MIVEIDAEAAEEIALASAWWREHRQAAPELFVQEIAAVLAMLGLWPSAGIRAQDTRLRGVRRLLMARVGYHVYFRVEDQVIVVLSVWHAKRRRPRI
jgi:plasmid stabilization system protein ParE